MASVNSQGNLNFPLFTRCLGQEKGFDNYLCLMDSMEFNQDNPNQRCGHMAASFDEAITHLQKVHGLSLNPRKDFCASCRIVFVTKYAALGKSKKR